MINIKTRIRQLCADGWVPYRLAQTRDGKPVELISYPFASDDGESILIYARTTPGTPTAQLWIVKGENDDFRDLLLLQVQCKHCNCKWYPRVDGEFKECHIECINCHTTYTAEYDNDKFIGRFHFHKEQLKLFTKKGKHA